MQSSNSDRGSASTTSADGCTCASGLTVCSYITGMKRSSSGTAMRASTISSSRASSVSAWDAWYSATCMRCTASSVRASSRHGKISTDSSSAIVWPVEGTMRRMRSISSSKNSMRTGEPPCPG